MYKSTDPCHSHFDKMYCISVISFHNLHLYILYASLSFLYVTTLCDSPYVTWIYVSVEIVHSCLEQFHNKIGDTGHTCVMAEYMFSMHICSGLTNGISITGFFKTNLSGL